MAQPFPDKAHHAWVLGLEDRSQGVIQTGPLLQCPRHNPALAQSPEGSGPEAFSSSIPHLASLLGAMTWQNSLTRLKGDVKRGRLSFLPS